MLMGIVDAFNNLPLWPLFDVRTACLSFGYPVDDVYSQIEAVYLVQDRQLKRSVNVALFFVAAYVEIAMVRPAIYPAYESRKHKA